MELKDIKKLFDKAYQNAQQTRVKAANDMTFYFETQWDDSYLQGTNLAFRGEFNILKKAGRHILSELAESPVQIDFEPRDQNRKDAAELADGLYRTDDTSNEAIESYENAKQESVVCGYGAWKRYTEYVSMRDGTKHQQIKIAPIYEANSTVFWDPDAKLLDKSDAKYVFILTPYSEDAYKELVHGLTGESEEDIRPESFETPEYDFNWYCKQSESYYVVEFYKLEKVKSKVLSLQDPFGQEIQIREETLKDTMDELLDSGFNITSEKKIEENRCTKYIASGKDILWAGRIAGNHIPIIPCYGEHAFVNGVEHWEGVVRLAKDPSRLRNFALSYLADIVSRSPRTKPIFFPEQISGHEYMYNESGPENNYPYLYQNRTTIEGEPLPVGPAGQMPEQPVPQSLTLLVDATRQAVEDVANPGTPQDIADPDMSGKAVYALQARLDMQSAVYQLHFKHAKRRDAEIWASMATEIYDIPRKATVTKPDGTRVEAKILENVVDKETGDVVTLNDMADVEFDVYSKIGPSYQSQKQQAIESLTMMYQSIDPSDPMKRVIQLKIFEMMDGVEFDEVREMARKELIIQGVRKPETEEEIAMVQQAQQSKGQADPNMILAQAELEKAKAMQMEAQINGMQAQMEAQMKQKQIDIEAFKAQTDRMNTELKAQETDSKISQTEIETYGKHIDNTMKVKEMMSMDMATHTEADRPNALY